MVASEAPPVPDSPLLEHSLPPVLPTVVPPKWRPWYPGLHHALVVLLVVLPGSVLVSARSVLVLPWLVLAKVSLWWRVSVSPPVVCRPAGVAPV